MMPRWHLLFGFVFSYSIVYFFDFSFLAGSIIFISSVLIDLDHVLVYFLETKDLHPKKFWEYSMKKKSMWDSLSVESRKKFKQPHFILHGIEFILGLVLVSFFVKIFLYVLIGISFHILCDLIVLIYRGEHLSFKTSQIWLFYRNKSKRFIEQNI